MNETLYLTLERSRRRWEGVRIVRVSKRKPKLKKPSEQALLRLQVNIPDNVLQPREVKVEIKPEHLVQPTITVTPSQP